jgi:SAM-dependent methyltransferase
MPADPFPDWLEALHRRHLAKLNFPEVRRAVQALSSLYVERRDRIGAGGAFGGAGKRAAYATYFAPLHFLLVREIVRALKADVPPGAAVLDLGCGTGAAGAAWALESAPPPRVIGVDRRSWVLEECRWTYEQLRIRGVVKSAPMDLLRIPANTAVIAAFSINELDPSSRERVRRELRKAADHGARVLIIEPIARRVSSWWSDWARDWQSAGGREDEWRFRAALPERIAMPEPSPAHRPLTLGGAKNPFGREIFQGNLRRGSARSRGRIRKSL